MICLYRFHIQGVYLDNFDGILFFLQKYKNEGMMIKWLSYMLSRHCGFNSRLFKSHLHMTLAVGGIFF